MPFAGPAGHAGAIETEEAIAAPAHIRRTNEPAGAPGAANLSIATLVNRRLAGPVGAVPAIA